MRTSMSFSLFQPKYRRRIAASDGCDEEGQRLACRTSERAYLDSNDPSDVIDLRLLYFE